MPKKDEVKSVSQGRGLTPKQEKFCQKYIETGNASEAYRQVYSVKNMSAEAIKVEASKLLSNPNISLTINEFKQSHQNRHNITVDKLLERLDRIYQDCMADEKPQYGVAMNAVMNQARLLGLDIPHSIELRKAQTRKYTLEGDKIQQELNHKTSANDKIQFIQEFD